jgi:hypothetical protein
MNTYFSSDNYLPNLSYSKSISQIKYECVLPFSFQRVLLGYLTNESIKKSDPNITRTRTLQYFTFEELEKQYENKKSNQCKKYKRNLAINASDIYLHSLLNPRVHNLSISYIYDPEAKMLIYIGKPFVKEGMEYGKPVMMEVVSSKGAKPKLQKAYPMFDCLMTVFQKLDDSRVLFTQTHAVDVGGWASNRTVLRQLAKNRGIEFMEKLNCLILQYPEDAKISDYEKELCCEKDGIPVDGFGKLLYDLNIDEADKEFDSN